MTNPSPLPATPVLTDPEARRDFLTEDEVARLCRAAGHGRHGRRDQALLLMMYRHGLRVSEAAGLRRSDLLAHGKRLYVRRLKGSLSTEHPLTDDVRPALNRYLRMRSDHLPWLFVSERGSALSRYAIYDQVR